MAYKLIVFDKISSTQIYAHELVADGRAKDRTAIMADIQTAGRGRYKRTWVSNPGNLYVSFIYENQERDPRLSYAVAVAVAETIISFGINSKIKWPNDILIDDKKVSGILIEYSNRFVIVGIGINIKSNPSGFNYKTTKLNNYANIDRSVLLSKLMKSLDKWIVKDFSLVQKRWTELAVGLNKVIKYRGEHAQMIGINENGALILLRGSEYVLVYGDEISL